jgi:Spy/CpxP family protein refolding chaperone
VSTKNQDRKAAPDKNHLTKEDTMKTVKTAKRISRGPIYLTLAAGFIIALGLITQPLMAKNKGRFGPPRSPDEIVQTMTDRLDLTSEQVEAIRPIIEEKALKMSEIRDRSGTDRRAVRTEMQKLRWNTEMKLGEILTEEQVDKYIELRQEQREKMHRGKFRREKMGGGFNKTPEQVIERLSARLDLTEEQAVEIEPIIKESIEKKRQIFDKYSEQGIQVRESMRNEMQSIGDETHDRLSTVLTNEQMEELLIIKEEKRARMEERRNSPRSRGF